MASSRLAKIEATKQFAYEKFSTYYERNKNSKWLKTWISEFERTKIEKNEEMAKKFRLIGNKLYEKRDFKEAARYYTKSLCHAPLHSDCYNLALGNRSAVYFELKKYLICLKDIDLCIETNCPKSIYLKLLKRKCECCFQLMLTEELKCTLDKIKSYLETEAVSAEDKEKYDVKKLKDLYFGEVPDSSHKETWRDHLVVPKDLLNKQSWMNENLKILDSEPNGRSVITTNKIKAGDFLFVEKPAFFAPLFHENEFDCTKCYFCFKTSKNLIPCTGCCICLYCDENCKNSDKFHRFECEGMKMKVWYSLGAAFPAWKSYLISLIDPQKYEILDASVDHLTEMESISEILEIATKTVTYLNKFTNFFDWMLNENIKKFENKTQLIHWFGSILMRSMSQIVSNASNIVHLCLENVPKRLKQIATGIFLNISLMNHSCKTNITIFYIDDTAIVRALEDLNEGDEVFNSYGLCYRYHSKDYRQTVLRQMHFFECKCEICSDPSKEIDRSYKMKPEIKEEILKIIGDDTQKRDLCTDYGALFDMYMAEDDILRYVSLALVVTEHQKFHFGNYSKTVGEGIYISLFDIAQLLQKQIQVLDIKTKRSLAANVSKLFEGEQILSLYFPSVRPFTLVKNKITEMLNISQ